MVYCRKFSVWHINFLNTILYYKHKAVLDSKLPALFILSNKTPGTSSNEQQMDQQFTVTVTAYCLGLKVHITNITVLKT